MKSRTKRPYRLRERARSQQETRQRIVEATMHLHEEIGPKSTTISAIAERSGVQRLTVYRHFADEAAVFQACTSHWLSLNPPPDPGDWAHVGDPKARFCAAVAAFYGYFSRTRRMWTMSFQDVAQVPALQGPMREFAAFMDGVCSDLIAAFGDVADTGHLSATVRHVLRFQTWSSLQDQGLDEPAKLELVSRWLCCPEG
jgi:AcrR family transcriptional regulator